MGLMHVIHTDMYIIAVAAFVLSEYMARFSFFLIYFLLQLLGMLDEMRPWIQSQTRIVPRSARSRQISRDYSAREACKRRPYVINHDEHVI